MAVGRIVRFVVALAAVGVAVAVNIGMDRMGLTASLAWVMPAGALLVFVIVVCAARLLQLLAGMLFHDRTVGDLAGHVAEVLLCGYIIGVCRRVGGMIVPAEWMVMVGVSGLMLVCFAVCWLDRRHDGRAHVL